MTLPRRGRPLYTMRTTPDRAGKRRLSERRAGTTWERTANSAIVRKHATRPGYATVPLQGDGPDVARHPSRKAAIRRAQHAAAAIPVPRAAPVVTVRRIQPPVLLEAHPMTTCPEHPDAARIGDACAACTLHHASSGERPPVRITRREDFAALASVLRLADWHEPDQQGVSASVHGLNLDTAGFWPLENVTPIEPSKVYVGIPEPRRTPEHAELYVTLHHEGTPIAHVNLAMLMSWASDLR